MTQEDLAKSVGVRRETISHLEKGKYNPSLQLAHDIARALHSTIDEVLFLRINKIPAFFSQRIPVFFIYTTITHTKPHEICPIVNIDPQYNPYHIHSSRCDTYLPQDEYSNLQLHSLFVITFPSQK